MKIGMILLAAGLSKRFGNNKLMAEINGKPMIEYILSNVPIQSFEKVVVVSCSQDVMDMADNYGIKSVYNNHPEQGISRSIRLGTEKLQGLDAYMYMVCDQPLLKKSTIQNMVSSYDNGTILALAHQNQRGNPVMFPDFLYDELLYLKTGESGQKVINAHLDLLQLYNISDNTQLMDVDTKDDFLLIEKIIKNTSV